MQDQSKEQARAKRIGQLNDHLRQNNSNPFGYDRTVLAFGLIARIEEEASGIYPDWFLRGEVRKMVAEFASFGKNNDPYGERDYGAFTWRGTDCFWKIDYYNTDLTGGSNDPTDPSITARVLTIGTIHDY